MDRLGSIGGHSGTNSDGFLIGTGTLWTGTDAPADVDGVDGDFYFRTNGTIYKRLAGAWTEFEGSGGTPSDNSVDLTKLAHTFGNSKLLATTDAGVPESIDKAASATHAGLIEICTDAEATTGTDETRCINAKQLAAAGGGGSSTSTVTLADDVTVGDFVAAVNSGDIEKVKGTVFEGGTPVVFESADTRYISCCKVDTNKIVIGYADGGNNGYGTAIVGTVSGTSISFGSPVVFESALVNYTSCCLVDTNKFVLCYQDVGNSGYGTAIVGTVSGTGISFGSLVVFESAATYYISCYQVDTNKVVIGYQDYGNSQYGTAIVGTVSGTSISFGTAAVFESAITTHISCCQVDTDKAVIGYRDGGNSNYGTTIVGTVSGTSISFGSPVVFESASTSYISCCLIDTSKIVIGYRDAGNNGYGTAIVGTVSGTSISFGTAAVFESASTSYISCCLVDTNKVVLCYQDVGNSGYGTAIVGTVSGTGISFSGSPVVFESASTEYISCCQIDTAKVVLCYQDEGNSDYGTAVVMTTESSNAADWIGVATETKTTGQSCEINTAGGADDNQSGLSVGEDYYLNATGTLGTTGIAYVGRAVAADTIILEGVTER
ncbi:MAG: hypothetical protein U9O94_06030 [Nanoarchaeota archaeon]|nr:hypothetical protein [Nanoarchaeota archaeon]